MKLKQVLRKLIDWLDDWLDTLLETIYFHTHPKIRTQLSESIRDVRKGNSIVLERLKMTEKKNNKERICIGCKSIVVKNNDQDFLCENCYNELKPKFQELADKEEYFFFDYLLKILTMERTVKELEEKYFKRDGKRLIPIVSDHLEEILELRLKIAEMREENMEKLEKIKK